MSLPVLPTSEASPVQWQRKAAALINAVARLFQAAGPTADRPTLSLFVNQQYFDTDLGRPIWWNGSAWIDATGTPS